MTSLLDGARQIAGKASDLEYNVAGDNYMAALRDLSLLAESFTDLAGDLAQAAYNAGATKKAIAAALGIAPSALRGMVRQGVTA